MVLCCASCGVAEVDDVGLTKCTNCDLVRYCSDECLTDHKSHHEDACKKRVAELRDELLFKLPASRHDGDCPICMIPLPLDITKSSIYGCCSKEICNGCVLANKMRENEACAYQKRVMEESLNPSCPFCRELIPITEEQSDKQRMIRIKANDPVELRREGVKRCNKGDYKSGFEYITKAAELGNAEAHYKLAIMYHHGDGVEKDREKEVHHLEEAAIGGHPTARHNLGCYESYINDNVEKAVKHWVIAAAQGYDDSIKVLMEAFKGGFVNKEALAATLRAHQAAVDATKSPQRDAAVELKRSRLESAV